MANRTVITLGCIMVAALVADAKLVGAAPSFAPEITVLVYNRVHVATVDVQKAERLAGEIFADTGIRVRWEEGSLADEAARSLDFSSGANSSGGCETVRAVRVLRVQLEQGPPHGLPNALGFALPCAKYVSHANIFVDRCQTVVKDIQTLSFSNVMGHAIAHEIGHVLLGPTEHSAAGLMRGRWRRADWQLAAQSFIRFDGRQALDMRENIAASGPGFAEPGSR